MQVDRPWWKATTVYQIYPRSFHDANGDGIGDLRGIIGKLDYLKELGVETLWLSPFFESPQADFGYDITNHFAIEKDYGTLEDCRALIAETHARGMRIVFDMVLNHTSDRHPWFLESKQSRSSSRRDWYVWRAGRKPGSRTPPNNWRSMLGGSGWHYDDASGDWYYASFLGCQPDLNYRNPAVKAAMLGVVRHWLDEGVDGFRLDVFNALFKDESFADNPFSWRPVPTESSPHGFFQKNLHTLDHPDTLAFARELRTVVDSYAPERFLVGEVFGDAAAVKRYCGAAADGLHLVFLFQTLRTRANAPEVRRLIEDLEREFPEPFSPTVVFGNHDRPRVAHRFGGDVDRLKLLAALQLTMRCVPFIYYGEEIGMENHDIPLHEGLDPVAARFRFVPQKLASWVRRHGIMMNRDECRTPMQWSRGANAGFTTGQAAPWLPLHPNSELVNVAVQERDPASLLGWYRALLKLRRSQPALTDGALGWPGRALPPEVVRYRRSLESAGDAQPVDVLLNFAARPRSLAALDRTPFAGAVALSSKTVEARPIDSVLQIDGHEALIIHRER